jgi:hypothetical protein
MSDSSAVANTPSLAVGPIWFRPRLSAILAAAAVLLLILAIDEAWLRNSPLVGTTLGFALANERDDYGYVSHALQNFGTPGQPDIIVIGTSAMREGLLAAPIMERLLKGKFGTAVRFHNLSTFDQTPTEALAIVAAAPLTRATVVVIEIKPRRLAHSSAELFAAYETPRIPALPDNAVREFLAGEKLIGWFRPPLLWRDRVWLHHVLEARIDPPVRDKLRDLVVLRCGYSCLSELATRAWFRVPHRYLAYAYPDLSLPDEQLHDLCREIGSVRVPEFRQNHGLDAAAIATIIDRARINGATVLLVDPPRHPFSLLAYAPTDAFYREDIAALVQRGAEYVDLSHIPQIRPADFYDLDHLRPSGRATFSRLLVDAFDGRLNGTQDGLKHNGRDTQ